jgi:hypothetical protein
MYAAIQAKKSIDLSKSPSRASIQASSTLIGAAKENSEMTAAMNDFKSTSMGKKILQFGEMNRFKAFLKEKMKNDYNTFSFD